MLRKSFIILQFILVLSITFTVCSCSKEEEEKEEEKIPHYVAGLYQNQLKIDQVLNIPDEVSFDKIKVKLTGKCWSSIDEVETTFHNGEAILTFPTSFAAEQLQVVDRKEDDFCGFWPATSDNPSARVSALKDIIAYQGEKKVGRLYLSNQATDLVAAKKIFIHYQYTNEPFVLKGQNKSYLYKDCSFHKGWNAYATINTFLANGEAEQALCTTIIPADYTLRWFFESWVY